MSEVWRLIDLGELDPYEYYPTLESIISSIGRGISFNTMTFVQMQDHVTIGTKTDRTKRVKLEYCKDKNIPVIRSTHRHSSSGFHDPGTLQCSLFLNKEVPFITGEELTHEFLIKYVLIALKSLGFQVTYPAKSTNLICSKKKIGTTGTMNLRKVLWLGLNIFIVSSVEKAEKTIVSRRDMRATCTTLSTERGKKVSVDEVRDAIMQSFGQIPNLRLEQRSLSHEEEVLREKLREKYTSESWIKYGKWSPVKDYWRPT